jgi:hypothetical protein
VSLPVPKQSEERHHQGLEVWDGHGHHPLAEPLQWGSYTPPGHIDHAVSDYIDNARIAA